MAGPLDRDVLSVVFEHVVCAPVLQRVSHLFRDAWWQMLQRAKQLVFDGLARHAYDLEFAAGMLVTQPTEQSAMHAIRWRDKQVANTAWPWDAKVALLHTSVKHAEWTALHHYVRARFDSNQIERMQMHEMHFRVMYRQPISHVRSGLVADVLCGSLIRRGHMNETDLDHVRIKLGPPHRGWKDKTVRQLCAPNFVGSMSAASLGYYGRVDAIARLAPYIVGGETFWHIVQGAVNGNQLPVLQWISTASTVWLNKYGHRPPVPAMHNAKGTIPGLMRAAAKNAAMCGWLSEHLRDRTWL